jgi:tRNA G18 (ribose-2'-O)-methylase SpoU
VFVVCPRIDNPENLGAIVRVADVFGTAGVLVGARCPDPLSRRVLRVSMGSALRLPVVSPPDLADELDRLGRDFGFETVAAVAGPDAWPLDDFRSPARLALLLGSEAHGLEPDWLARCDRRVTIPMAPGVDSLNVAVAAGILLYHATRPGRAGGM